MDKISHPFVTYILSTISSLLVINGDITPKGATEFTQIITVSIGGIGFIIAQVWMFTHHTEVSKAKIAQGTNTATPATNTINPS